MSPKIAEPDHRRLTLATVFVVASAIAAASVVKPMFALAAALSLIALALAVWRPFWLLLIFIAIFPFAPYLAHPKFPLLTLPKLLFALALIGFAIALLTRKQRPLATGEIKFALAWLVFAIASLTWSADVEVGAVAAASLFGMIALMALVANFTKEKAKIETVVRLILIQCFVFCAFGIFQFATRQTIAHVGYYPDIDYFITFRGLVRASSVFLHPNDFSNYLVIAVPLAAVWGFERKRLDRVLGLLVATAGLVSLALTFTRSAWVALALAVLLTLFRRYWRAFAGLGIVLAFAGSVAFIKFQRDAELVLSRFELRPDRSVSDRVWAYDAAWGMIKSSPAFGVGAGQFAVRYPEFRPYEASWTAKGERVPMTAHNMILEVASELGALGLFLFLGFIYLVFRRVRALNRSADALGRIVGAALGCGLLAFFIQAQFNNQLYMEIGWIAAGLVIGAGEMSNERR